MIDCVTVVTVYCLDSIIDGIGGSKPSAKT